MAVTSIWPIKGRVDKVINYARNPEKTHDKERLSELHEIEGVVEYAADEMKTEKRAYVTCLNLHSEETAAQEFMETKRLMHSEQLPLQDALPRGGGGHESALLPIQGESEEGNRPLRPVPILLL